jgi:HSP20 family protein
MAKSTKHSGDGENPGGMPGELGGLLGGLGNLIGKLSELAEKGKELHELKEFGTEGGAKGVYGFTIKSDIGRNAGRDGGVKVEPFGNVAKDERTGRAMVREVTVPPVDIFEEAGHILVVAELPGVCDEDIRLELRDDVLEITAERGPKKYHKEVLLPASFEAPAMTSSCRNGVLEIKLTR